MWKTSIQIEQRHGSSACNFHHSKWNQYIVYPTQSNERNLLLCDNQIAKCSQETNTTAGTREIVNDDTPVQIENKEQPSPTRNNQSELVSDKPKLLSRLRNQRNIAEIFYLQNFLEKDGERDNLWKIIVEVKALSMKTKKNKYMKLHGLLNRTYLVQKPFHNYCCLLFQKLSITNYHNMSKILILLINPIHECDSIYKICLFFRENLLKMGKREYRR